MKIIITENKIKNIVRSELKNYLIQEGIFDTIRNVAGTAFGNATKDLQKNISKSTQDLKTAIIAANPTPEFAAIKTKLKPLGIEGNNLQAVYNYLYTKDKGGKYVFSVEDSLLTTFEANVNALKTIVRDHFDNLKPSIPTALQEAPIPLNPAAGGGFAQVQQQAKNTPSQKIQNFYEAVLKFIEDSKQSKQKENILIGSVLLYACQIANQAINIKNVKNPKQLGQLYSDFFKSLNEDINKLPSKQQPAAPATP